MRKAAAALLALAVIACRGEVAESSNRNNSLAVDVAAARPQLALLTALPIAFAEGFSLDAPAHPAMAALESAFSVRLVDGPGDLKDGGLLLAAQPRALTAERLVELDRWVRNGGRMVLLADPMLEWESGRPLGDPLRPPLAFADTGLLRRWGLTLHAPDEQGPRSSVLAGRQVLTASPGTLSATSQACQVEAGGLLARCRVGRGEVVVIADADFLNLAGEGALDGPTDGNLAALVAVLDGIGRK